MGEAPIGPDDTERARTLWFAVLLTLTNGFMDAHTFLVRGGVFANVQTGNVIFFAIGASERKVAAALAVQMGLFRNIGDLAYLPVATTGNLMRFVESGYDGIVEKKAEARRACGIYGTLILAFTGGALIGAFASRAWGPHAIWLAAGILAVTLVLFIVDERVLR